MANKASSGTVRVVSRQDELDAAYQELRDGSGGTILLNATDTYTLTAIDQNGTTDSAVTIRSADPENVATISAVRLIGTENLTIENVQFHLDGDQTRFDDVAVRLTDATNITIKNSVMTSNAEGPLGTDSGFLEGARLAIVRESEGITFEGNQISNFSHGLAFMNSYDVAVLNNDISALQGDAIRVAGVSGMQIEGNHLHDFYGATQEANHSDMIQIWGSNITVNNEDVTITKNFLDTGNGANYQMIFGHNEDFKENGFTFSDILIEDNVLFGSHANAIAIKHTDHATVVNNTIIYNTDTYQVMADGSRQAVNQANRIEIEGTNTLIENNISQRVVGGVNNELLTHSSPYLENDYRAHFINIEAGGSGDLRDLMLRPDSELNGTAGSRLTWSTDTAELLTAVADVTFSDNDRSVVTLDAGLSRGPEGYVAAQGATFSWSFSDGSTGTGKTVTHDFGTAGTHSYQLTVKQSDGTKDTIIRTVEIESPLAVKVTFEDNLLTSAGSDAFVGMLHENAKVSNNQLEIGGRERLEVSRDTMSLFNLNDFNIGITANVAAGSSGTLLHLPRTFEATIDSAGYIHVSLTTEDGTFEMTSSDAHFADAGTHTLNFLYDGAADTLSLLVDGAVDSAIEATGITTAQKHWGLTLGATWGDSVDARISDFYVLTEAITLEEAEAARPAVTAVETVNNVQSEQIVDLQYALSSNAMITPEGYDITRGTVTVLEEEAAIHAVDAFTVGFDMRLSDAETDGTLMYLHDMLSLSLDEHGRLVFRLNTEDGWEQIASEPLGLEAGTPHHIAVTYDAAEETMQIQMDDTVVATGTHSGTTTEAKYWDLYFGHPWSEDVAAAVVDNITAGNTADLGVMAPALDVAVPPVIDVEAPNEPVTADPEENASTFVFLDFEDAQITDTSGRGHEVTSVGKNIAPVYDAARGEQVIEITDSSALRISRDSDALYNLSDFMFSLDMRSDQADGRNVFGIHQSYRLDVVDDDFVFRLETTEGTFVLETNTDLLADRDWHSVEIAYSDEYDQLQMVVDGNTVATTEASGTTQAREHWGLDIGWRWGDGFEGAIDKFALMTDIGAHHFDLS
jgi:PKD repeat protein